MNLEIRKSSAIKSLRILKAMRIRGLILPAAMVAIGALASAPASAQERNWYGGPDYGGYYDGSVRSYGGYRDTPAWRYGYPAYTYDYGGPSYNADYPYGYRVYAPYGYYSYYPYGYAPAPGIGVRVGPVGIGVFP